MKSDFHQRQENRRDRALELAEKNDAESKARHDGARNILSYIPPGQPILVGHHSEGRHRRDLAKVDNHMRKGIEAESKAKHYREKASTIGASGAIFSDDPTAIEQLSAKIERLEADQALWKAINKIIRSKPKDESTPEKCEALLSLGLKPGIAASFFVPDCHGCTGIPSYRLSNNNANIKRCKGRLASLEREALQAEVAPVADREVECEGQTVRIVESTEDNRLQLYFDGKPSPEVRSRLKQNGYRWARSIGCWQRHLNNSSRATLIWVFPGNDELKLA